MIKIFRYGNLLAQVDGEKELRKWIMANVPYDKRAGTMFKTSTLKEIAREKGYGFSDRDKEGVDPELAGRLGLVLSFVTLQDVVADLGGLDKRGLHLVGVCPHCHERMMVVYPQLYKCFGCGETGNILTYVMAERKTRYEDALNYLESKYVNK